MSSVLEEGFSKGFLQAKNNKGIAAVLLIDLKGDILTASASIKQQIGYSPEELKGKNGFTLVHPDDFPKSKRLLSELARKPRASVIVEARIRRKKGDWILCEITGTNLIADQNIGAVVVTCKDIRKSRQTEDKLRLSEARFRALFTQSPLSIQIFTPDGYSLEVNHAWEAMWNSKADEVKGYNILKDEQLIAQGVMSLIRQGFEGKVIETPIVMYDPGKIGKNGRVRYAKAFVFPVTDDKGNITQIVLKHIDLTDLVESQENYKVLTDTSPDGIMVLNEKGEITYINPALDNMFANPLHTVFGSRFDKYLTRESVPAAEKLFSALTKGEVVKDTELQAIHHDGHTFPIEVSASPLIKNGHFRGIECVIRDVSERKKIETNLAFLSDASRLLNSSLDYQTTMQSVARMVVPYIADWCAVVFFEEGKINLIAVAHKDPKKEELVRRLQSKLPPQTNAYIAIERVLKTGKPVLYSVVTNIALTETTHEKKQLELLKKLEPRSAMIVPVSQGKKIFGAIYFVISETTKKYNKTDLIIAEEVANRAGLAIQNALLFEETKKAVSLRDEFISASSHELKTPVTSLKLYTQALKSRYYQKVPGLTPYLNKIESQTNKLIKLVNDLLNVSRLQHGKLDFHMRKFNLLKLIKETVDIVQETKPTHKIIIKGTLKRQVYGDKFRISQVLINLLTNAIKFSPKMDEVLVNVVDGNQAAIISVQDFGIGIIKLHQKKIFTRFYRVSGTNEITYPGLGMGLYITSEIIKRHNGTLVVDSEKGKGSVFTFTLPYHKR